MHAVTCIILFIPYLHVFLSFHLVCFRYLSNFSLWYSDDYVIWNTMHQMNEEGISSVSVDYNTSVVFYIYTWQM